MTAPRGLHALARLHGLQTAYHDNDGRRVAASPEALLATLRAMGVAVDRAGAIPAQLARRRHELRSRMLEPVVVVWTPAGDGPDGVAAGTTPLRTHARLRDEAVTVRVGLEAGGERTVRPDPATLELRSSTDAGGTPCIERVLPLPSVPTGYHDLVVEVGQGPSALRQRALLVAAPARVPGWNDALGRSAWGLFAPLYGLWRAGSEEAPSYATLEAFARETAEAGGAVIGTLPLLAAFLDRPWEPSPYAPVSRLFWNGLYVRPRDGAGSAPPPHPGDRQLDPRSVMAERRAALEAEARSFFGRDEETLPTELEPFLARNPLAEDYARFRALTEALGPWPGWPDRLRARDVRPGDYDADVARYHLYLQWRAERQLAEASEGAASRGVSLYLDLPMGVHSHGYDVWRERALFATGATAGAPPDPLAAGGQDWGFPPLDPEASRRQRHRYFIAALRTHLRFARVLRLDHVMQLHRLFWVPDGDARQGVYVRYPAEELWAILSLEAHRAGAVIVGEDLGTVPRSVRRAMARRGVPGMYVLEFELTDVEADADADAGAGADANTDPDGGGWVLVPRRVRPGALASIGTHDTPTFAGWWWGEDVRVRREAGELDEAEAERELEGRGVMRARLARGLGVAGPPDGAATARAVHAALLERMGRSEAGLVLATVEDLWLEREPQNVPGTTGPGNWRRRLARPLEALSDPAVSELLGILNEAREGLE